MKFKLTTLMMKEINNILKIDLSERLPYGVVISVTDFDGFTFEGTLTVMGKTWCRLDISDPVKKAKVKNKSIPLRYISPYLRPLSSMTEDERKEYDKLSPGTIMDEGIFLPNINQFDYLILRHFDVRGLIPRGLALEAKEGMYK